MTPHATVLDETMPDFASREYHSVALPSVRCDVIQAVSDLTWAEVPGMRRIFNAGKSKKQAYPGEQSVLSSLLAEDFVLLHRSHAELVMVCVLWPPRGWEFPALGEHPTDEYRALRPEGAVKTATNFRYADGVLSTETRNQPIGARATTVFGFYWFFIRMGSGFIRRSWLAGARRRALRLDQSEPDT